MPYEVINPDQQFNFQINRILTYGEKACNTSDVKWYTSSIRTLNDWFHVWRELAEKAESQDQFLHAAYYYRMLEFFMKETDEKKDIIYKKCIGLFYRGFDKELHLSYEHLHVPFRDYTLNCIRINAQSKSKGTLLVCGGYDSFIEEFVLQIQGIADNGYNVILFEGPGQGECLKQKLYFQYDFEKPTQAVIDYFSLEKCIMVGISWGGYFALRSAAFDKKITAVAAYDVMYDGLEVMTAVFPPLICHVIRTAFEHHHYVFLDIFAGIISKKNVLADWALAQGTYITGTKTVHELYEKLSLHTLKGIEDKITQDVLLLAGEKDHYIPSSQYETLKENIHFANSLSCHMFTQKEGGEQHCQIGDHMLAINYILNWLTEECGI